MTDFIAEFAQILQKHGIGSAQPIIADGNLRRYQVEGDPKNRKNGWYRLTIENDIAFAAFGSWKHGVNEGWCSKKKSEITKADRAKIKARQEARAAEERERQQAAAKRAKKLWAKTTDISPSHPYLKLKGIKGTGAKQLGKLLVAPMYADGKIISLQFITDDGDKRFLRDGKVDGCYTSISSPGASREIIYICEGFATGASIHEATGFPVVVAYNAGNLKPVALKIREKYVAAKLIIAADNDQWTKRQNGIAWNPGIEYGQLAADSCGGELVWPHFAANDPRRPTDFNDMHRLAGLEALRDSLIGKPVSVPGSESVESEGDPQPPASEEERSDLAPRMANWKNFLIEGKEAVEGFPHPFNPKSKFNAYYFLKYDEYLKDILIYNEFSDEIMIMRCPPWEEPDEFRPRRIENEDFLMFATYLERLKINVGQDVAAGLAIKIAKENKINPPREYFDTLVWDGEKRLDKWLTYYLGAEEQPPEYLALIGSKWMIGAVSRIYQPGAKFDSVLILEGGQGIGKSTVLRTLATFNNEEYFLDSVGDIRNKDTLMTMQGKIIIETAELASFKKAENEEIKGFISRQVDEYRPPYGRTIVKRPRYFVLAGSTNEVDDGYLTDDTGNRRYWPVKCGSIDLASLREAQPQLWAEAVYRYKSGERTWLNRDEICYSTEEQKKRQIEDAWQDRIRSACVGKWEISIDEVCTALELKPRDINNVVKKRIKNSLRLLGWYETRRAGQGRIWKIKEGVTTMNEKLSPDTEILLES